MDLYVVDWGSPTRSDRWLTLEDYIEGYLADCVEKICEEQGIDQVTLLGICEGGVFTTCYAANHPKRVKNLMLTITPIDFHAGDKNAPLHHGMIGTWARSMSATDVDRLIEANGNLPGELMSFVFSLMTPINSLTKYNVGLFDVMDDEAKLLNFLRMEKWLADRPDHPGEAGKQWLKDLYQANQLAKGEFRLNGKLVDLKKVTMPVLNIFAQEDHIIPPKSSQALGKLVGTKDYTELPLPGGHVGVFVSGKSQGIVGKNIYGWLKQTLTPAHGGGPRARAARLRAHRLCRMGPAGCGAGGAVRARPHAQRARLRLPRPAPRVAGHARRRARISRAAAAANGSPTLPTTRRRSTSPPWPR